jgi:hypothetical protein
VRKGWCHSKDKGNYLYLRKKWQNIEMGSQTHEGDKAKRPCHGIWCSIVAR